MTDFLEPAPTTNLQGDWLKGGGEMGDLIRLHDWSRTSFGPIENWPAVLVSTLSLCLSARFPMAIYWDTEGFLLYNDAWRPILGNKHPRALGRGAREVWPEVWDSVAPFFESVRTTGEATRRGDELLPMQRFGYTEECYFDYSFNPIRGQSGKVEGILNVVVETTYRVLNDRRARLLRELAAKTSAVQSSEANACETAISALATDPADIPFALLYVVTPDGCRALLRSAIGLPADNAARPAEVDLTGNLQEHSWPLASAVRGGSAQIVDDLPGQFGEIPPGFWPEPTTHGLVLPLGVAGQEGVAAILVAGINPRHPLDDDYRHFFGLVGAHFSTVLTNARAYEEEQRRAAALAEIDRAKTEFFSNVSHEFRTPLTLLLGPLEDLLGADPDPVTRERLEVARRNSQRLLRLVNTLLDFSRIEAGRTEASYEPTDLAAFTTELASVFRSAVEKAGLKLTVDCPPLDESVSVDREMWEKIVLNLISNAFKFTFEGEIEVSLKRDGDHVVLAVRDTGTGIPADELPHLFERFHRVRGAKGRTYEGSGIGLALVQELVKLHGGHVSVASQFGAGIVFTILIPLGVAHLPAGRLRASGRSSTPANADAWAEEALRWLPAETNGTPEVTSHVAESDTSADGASARAHILLADDNADMRDYVRRLLSERFEVESVGDGEAALEATRDRRVDLILSDVMMPRLDGFGLLRALRGDERTRSIPVILLSARAGEESRIQGLQAGADDYLVKPFSARELTARVEAMLKLAKVRRQAQERITDIWESITDGFVAFDREWRYIYLNAAAERMGLRRDQLLGRTLWTAFPTVVGTELEERFRRAADEQISMEFEYYFAPWDRWFNIKIFPTPDGNIGLYFRDGTDHKRLEDERTRLLESERVARRQAEEASRLKDEFLATVSHELKTPLNAIQGWAALLRAGTLGADQAARALGTIERSAKSQDQLINDLLDVSRIITGRMRLDLAPIRLDSVIKAAVDAVKPAADAKEIRLDVLLDPAAEMTYGDAERLQQVVWNLLSNAIKFTPKGGRVQVRLERVDARVEIIVADNGKGIKPEFLPNVFDRFRQEDGGPSRQQGGLGLGLAIVRHLVELHGGTVDARSAGQGQGATFTVRFPLVAGRTVLRDESKAEARTPAPRGALLLPGVRVLLVDDDNDGRELVTRILALDGAEVREAASAEAALNTLEGWRPDILISDIGMPEEDGYVLMEKLRTRERARDEKPLPAVALTAYTRPEDRERALSTGYQAHVTKPIDSAKLLAVVASLINRTTAS